MEVTSIQNGIIIDHVPAGTALKVLEYLKIDPSKTKLALIMNADSHMYGTKDIIKIEDETESIDLDVLGLVARTATVGIVRGGKIVRKEEADPAGTCRQHHQMREPALRHHHRACGADVPSGAFRPSGIPLRLLRRGSEVLKS